MKAQSFFYTLPIVASLLCSAIAAENEVTSNPNKAGDGVQVGVGGRDGVTVSGGEAYVTRNGATEKLVKDLILPSGVIAQPDGTIVLKGGTTATLKASQVLTFEGKIMELPANAGVNDNPSPAPAPQVFSGAVVGVSADSDTLILSNDTGGKMTLTGLQRARIRAVDGRVVELANLRAGMRVSVAYLPQGQQWVVSRILVPATAQPEVMPVITDPRYRSLFDGDITTNPGEKAAVDRDITTKAPGNANRDGDITTKADR